MALTEIGWKFVDWISIPQDSEEWRAVVNVVNNIVVLIKFGEIID